jgi:hypothetical protein
MIEFSTVSAELRSLVTRRRYLMTFIGSVFAATGIFLQNTLHGSLPPALKSIEEHVFAFYAIMLMVPTLILALRIAKMHAGMVINGILYARLMQEQNFTRPGDPQRAARHNFVGVSFLQFLLVSLLAAISAAVLGLAIPLRVTAAMAMGAAVLILWLAWYFWFHHQAARFAFQKIAADACAPFTKAQWEEHISSSMEEANHGLMAELGLAGLIAFSVFEKLSGLGEIKAARTDLASEDIVRYGPLVYAVLLTITCFIELIVYLRVRVAIGHFSLQLDASDKPFRPLRLTDSLLGYMILAFLFAVGLHLLMTMLIPAPEDKLAILLVIDAVAFGLAVLAEQVTLVIAGRRAQRVPVASEGEET